MTTKLHFDESIQADEREFLEREYREYIEATAMTEDELSELSDWVSQGYSPYGNPANITNEKGYEVDFVQGIRIISDMIAEHEALN